MNSTSRMRTKTVGLAVIALLVTIVTWPMLGMAQDASPVASPASQDTVLARGDQIFHTVCMACHQPDGKGIAGVYLPLAGNPAVTLDDPTYMLSVLLTGRGGMPRFNSDYSDADLAAIATYVRQSFGNNAPAVTEEQVAVVRASIYSSPEEEATPQKPGQIPTGSTGTPASTPESGG
jgi:mono/diheme cytochrome c family protein